MVRHQVSNLATWVRFPQDTLLIRNAASSLGWHSHTAGSSNGRMGHSECLDVGSIPTPAALRNFGPVAQRQRQLPYKKTIGGSSPPRITSGR